MIKLNDESVDDVIFSRTVGNTMIRIMNSYKDLPIYCDSSAAFRITHGYISGKYEAVANAKVSDQMRIAWSFSNDIFAAGAIAGRRGGNVFEAEGNGCIPHCRGPAIWGKMHNWYTAFSFMLTSSVSPENREAHQNMKMGMPPFDLEELSFSSTRAGRSLGTTVTYRVVNLFFLIYSDAIYVIDHSTLDQLHLTAKRWEGNYQYACNYRATGWLDQPRYDIVGPMDKCRLWISNSMIYSGFSDSLARVMKQSLALIQNEFHSCGETLDVQWDKKSEKLKADIRDILDLPVQWHDHLYSLNIPDRAKLDLSTLYYGLPSPDCDPRLLFKKASETMKNPKKADTGAFHRFMNYVKTYDLCKALCKHGASVSYRAITGYNASDEPWFKKCCKGKFTLPHEDDYGKAWIEGYFSFNDLVPTWYWEAANVTRVRPEAEPYKDMEKMKTIPRHEHSELLYALKEAPLLAHKVDPEFVIEGICDRTLRWDIIAMMAAKNENTKPWKKARETWSADAITREATTTYDRCAIPIANLYNGATIRKPDYKIQRSFNKICEMTRPGVNKRVIIISNDVSGWSPSGDRSAWSAHHDYLVKTTKAPRSFCLNSIWEGVQAILNKRGFIKSCPLPSGLFQGWTGTADTVLNVHMSLYCMRMAKLKGILVKDDVAITAGLIDDAVQAIELHGTIEQQQQAADVHFDTTCKIWSELAAEIDFVKTIYSSIKFIFLNRFFCEGSEVFIPCKVFAKADKEWNRRFASIHSQIDTIMGAYLSAVNREHAPCRLTFRQYTEQCKL